MKPEDLSDEEDPMNIWKFMIALGMQYDGSQNGWKANRIALNFKEHSFILDAEISSNNPLNTKVNVKRKEEEIILDNKGTGLTIAQLRILKEIWGVLTMSAWHCSWKSQIVDSEGKLKVTESTELKSEVKRDVDPKDLLPTVLYFTIRPGRPKPGSVAASRSFYEEQQYQFPFPLLTNKSLAKVYSNFKELIELPELKAILDGLMRQTSTLFDKIETHKEKEHA